MNTETLTRLTAAGALPGADALQTITDTVAALKAGRMTLTAARKNNLYINMPTHNKKLKTGARDTWRIYNTPAVITCPYATESCKKLCYAVKAEKAYPTVYPARLKNFEISRGADFTARMIYTIAVEKEAADRRGKRLNIRIHESGDFYNQTYTDKWYFVADYFRRDKNVYFWAYTKSFDFITADSAKVLNIRGSVWADTDPAEIAKIDLLQLPIYTAATADEITALKNSGEKIHICRCKDCATCRACISGKIKKIVCEIH